MDINHKLRKRYKSSLSNDEISDILSTPLVDLVFIQFVVDSEYNT